MSWRSIPRLRSRAITAIHRLGVLAHRRDGGGRAGGDPGADRGGIGRRLDRLGDGQLDHRALNLDLDLGGGGGSCEQCRRGQKE